MEKLSISIRIFPRYFKETMRSILFRGAEPIVPAIKEV